MTEETKFQRIVNLAKNLAKNDTELKAIEEITKLDFASLEFMPKIDYYALHFYLYQGKRVIKEFPIHLSIDKGKLEFSFTPLLKYDDEFEPSYDDRKIKAQKVLRII